MPSRVIDNGALADYGVAIEDASGSDVQIVRLGVPGSSSGAVLPGDATYGMDVDITRLPGSTTGTQNPIVVGITATLLCAALPGRLCASVRPSGLIYFGYTNGVTVANGMPIYGGLPGEAWDETYNKGALYAISPSGNVNTRVLET